MFGMLDYRAYKARLALFGFPMVIIVVLAVVGLPLVSVLVGTSFGSTVLSKVIYSVLALLVVEIIYVYVFVAIVMKVLNGVFNILIDVVPTDNRTKEEAEIVAQSGRLGIILTKLSGNPRNWEDRYIEEYAGADWVERILFQGRARDRLYALREWYQENEEVEYNEFEVSNLVYSLGINAPLFEQISTNKMYRGMALRYLIFIGFLFIYFA
jgi:hypothetical protein